MKLQNGNTGGTGHAAEGKTKQEKKERKLTASLQLTLRSIRVQTQHVKPKLRPVTQSSPGGQVGHKGQSWQMLKNQME